MTRKILPTFRTFNGALLTTSFQPMGLIVPRDSEEFFCQNSSDTGAVLSWDGVTDMFYITNINVSFAAPYAGSAWPAGQMYIRGLTAGTMGIVVVNFIAISR